MSRRFRRASVTRARWTLLAAALVAVALAAPAAAKPYPGTVVGVVAAGDVSALTERLKAAGLKTRPLPRINAVEVKHTGPGVVRRVLGSDARVKWIEANATRTLLVEPSSAMDPTTGRAFDWAYDAVDAAEALALAGGGSPVRVAIIDSGIDASHPDLAGRVGPPEDIASGEADPPDLVGHGTFIAGLISAVDGNGIGGRGVAGVTTVLPVRVTTSGSITSADAAAGIVSAVDAGARVINLSFGGPTLSAAERAALDYAAARDVLAVAASGNSRQSGNPVIYPAAAIGGTKGGWSAGLSVGATDPSGSAAPFSTSNDFVSVSAPGAGAGDDCGDGVFSTIPQALSTIWDSGGCLRMIGTLGSPTGRYGYGEGTRFAAPLVAGAAALVRGVNSRLTAAQAADVIRRTAHQTVGTTWNTRTGTGVLDMDAAVALARRYDTAAPAPVITATPMAGAVRVAVTVKDGASATSEQSGLASVRLEASSGGATFTTLVPDQAATITTTDPAGPGARRWYRATACDASRNCATSSAGPVVAGALVPTVAAVPPSLVSVFAGRPATCRNCVQVVFRVRGRGPLTWMTEVGGAGVKLARRSVTIASARRVSTLVTLSRVPACGGRLDVAIRLRSSLGSVRVIRAIRVGGRCLRATSTSWRG